MSDQDTKEREIWTAMCKLWQMLQAAKPTERNEIARRYAVTVTELEKVMGYFDCFVLLGFSPGDISE